MLYKKKDTPIPEITCKKDFRSLRIYIKEILFLELRLENHDGVQSWKEDKEGQRYLIEFYRKQGDPIMMEFDELDKWKSVLDLIDKNI